MNDIQKQAILREIRYSEDELARWKFSLETRKRNGEDTKYHESQIGYYELAIKRLGEGL
jgi:hypothetical protein